MISIHLRSISAVLDLFEDAAKSKEAKMEFVNKSKAYAQCTFYNIKYNIETKDNKQLSGWFTEKNLNLPFHRDFSLEQLEKKSPDNKMNSAMIPIRYDENCKFCRFIDAVDRIWQTAYNQTTIKMIRQKSLHTLIVRDYPDAAPDDKAGKPLPNPLIRVKFDFRIIPKNHPNPLLRGQPATKIYDYTKKIEGPDGKHTYKEFTVINDNGEEEPVNLSNLHKVVTRTTFIRNITVDLSSISVASYSCLPIKVTSIYIEQVIPAFINDDEEIDFTPEVEDKKNNPVEFKPGVEEDNEIQM